MATFDSQIQDLVGTFTDQNAMDDFLTHGARELLNVLPNSLKRKFRERKINEFKVGKRGSSPEEDNYENCKNRSVVKRKNCFEDCMDSSEDKRECYKACHCNHSIRMQQCIRKHRDEFENWREFCEEAKSSVCSTIPQCRGVNDPVYLERPCYCKCNCNDPDCPACEGTIFDIFS